MRLHDALQRFALQLEADGRSPHTITQYKRHIAALARWLAREGRSDELDAIDHETLARFLVSPDAHGSARGGAKRPTSVNALRSSLMGFFGFCRDAGFAPEHAGRLIRRARCGTAPPRGLSEEDQRRLLDTLASALGPLARRDHLLFHLLLASGVRLSSALALRACDVDLERGDLVLWNAKGQRTERVILGRAIREHLAGYLAGRPSGPLFPGSAGRPMSRRHAARRLRHWLRKAGCRGQTSPHGLRHSFGMAIYRQTRDLFVVKAALHHRSIVSSMVYAAADEQRLREVLC